MKIELKPQELAELLQKPSNLDFAPFGWVVQAGEDVTGSDGVFCRTRGALDMLLATLHGRDPIVTQVFAACI